MAKAFWKKNCIVFVFSVFADDSLLGSGASQNGKWKFPFIVIIRRLLIYKYLLTMEFHVIMIKGFYLIVNKLCLSFLPLINSRFS